MYDDHLLIFTHIPKCAGTSLDRGLRQVFGSTCLRVSGRHDPKKMTAEQRAELRALTGHFQYVNPYEALFGRKPLYIASVRDPMARAISGYAYLREKHERYPDRYTRFAAPVDQAIENLIELKDPLVTTGQCFWVSGQGDAKQAIANIEANYLAVATPKGMRPLLDILAPSSPDTWLGPLDEADMHQNKSNAAKFVLSDKVREKLHAACEHDRRLVDWVQENEARLLARAAERMAELQRDFRPAAARPAQAAPKRGAPKRPEPARQAVAEPAEPAEVDGEAPPHVLKYLRPAAEPPFARARVAALTGDLTEAARLYARQADRDPALAPAAMAERAVLQERAGAWKAAEASWAASFKAMTPRHAKFLKDIRGLHKAAVGADNGRKPSVEAFVFTHVTRKMVRNAALAPPSLGLINRTIETLIKQLNGRRLPITILFDRRDTPEDQAYQAALEELCARRGYKLEIRDAFGLRQMWLEAIRLARAKYMLMVEHDWRFLAPCPPLADMVATMEARPDILHLRINKRATRVAGMDAALIASADDVARRVVGTVNFSNNPALIRRKALERLYSKLVTSPAFDAANSGAGGVEENIVRAMRGTAKVAGMLTAQHLFGTFIWGRAGEGPFIRHTGV